MQHHGRCFEKHRCGIMGTSIPSYSGCKACVLCGCLTGVSNPSNVKVSDLLNVKPQATPLGHCCVNSAGKVGRTLQLCCCVEKNKRKQKNIFLPDLHHVCDSTGCVPCHRQTGSPIHAAPCLLCSTPALLPHHILHLHCCLAQLLRAHTTPAAVC